MLQITDIKEMQIETNSVVPSHTSQFGKDDNKGKYYLSEEQWENWHNNVLLGEL